MPFRYQSLRFVPTVPTGLLVLAVAGCLIASLAAIAAPHLEFALDRQYELAAERPYDAAVQNDLGNLLLLAGRAAAAEEAYHRALEIDGSHLGARFNLGLLEQQNGQHQEALEHFSTLLELEPRNAWAHYQSGVSLQELDRRKDAVEHYSRAFGLDPTLSFAENNPHIVDNTMVTESLLLSSRYGVSPTRTVARQYDDPERIAQLMLEQVDAAAAAEQAADEKPQPVQRATPAEGGRMGARPDDVPVIAVDDDVEDPDGEGGDSNRVITEDDLGGVQLGGAVGGPSSAGPDVRRRTRRNAAGRNTTPVRPSRVLGGDRAPSGNLDGERYRPSRRSSASLDLKLLPEEEIG